MDVEAWRGRVRCCISPRQRMLSHRLGCVQASTHRVSMVELKALCGSRRHVARQAGRDLEPDAPLAISTPGLEWQYRLIEAVMHDACMWAWRQVEHDCMRVCSMMHESSRCGPLHCEKSMQRAHASPGYTSAWCTAHAHARNSINASFKRLQYMV